MAPTVPTSGGGADGAFLAGLIVGAGGGFLLGPAVRSWLARREWVGASRRARLTDRVLERMEREAETAPRTEPLPPEASPPTPDARLPERCSAPDAS